MGNNISERLILVIKHINLSTSAFAKNIGISQPQMFNYTKSRQPSLTIIEKILEKYPEISAEWLVTGKGEMLKNNYQNIDNLELIKHNNILNEVLLENRSLNKKLVSALEKTILLHEKIKKLSDKLGGQKNNSMPE
ncbi:MAG: helix-turn-helix domain-containing protein [Prevotellaceae bacterium]|jgi:predicted transcriptional regulator|nr:helix-turn-helix domain-containing protein [Prevotellaceae bacterium]